MMIKKLPVTVKLFFLLTITVISCTSHSPYPDLRPGYTQYLACIKQCDSLRLVYTTEYNNCNKNCPAPMPDLTVCGHVPPKNQQACIQNALAPTLMCEQCSSDYIKHMQEIDSCKQACLETFTNVYRTVATN